jgi:hypothetical protein
MFWFLSTSNKPRLRDPTKVLQIMAKYWFDVECEALVEQDADGQHHLSIQGDGWPSAWLLPPGATPEDYYPDFDTPGQEEFAAFLTDIAPFLLEPLIVQAIGTATGEFPLSAGEWRVDPGSTMVTKTEFTVLAENPNSLVLVSA